MCTRVHLCVCVCSEAGLQYVSIDFFFFYCCLIVKSFCQSVFITVCSNKCFGRSLKISRFFFGGGGATYILKGQSVTFLLTIVMH